MDKQNKTKINKKGLGLNPLVINIVMVATFTLFIFSFVSLSLNTQNPDSEVLDSKYGLNDSMTRMENVIDNFATTSDSVYTQLGESEPTAVDFIFLIFKGAFYIPYTFLTFIFIGLSALMAVIFPALAGTGLGTIVSITMGVLFSSIIVTIVLLIVKSIRTGESLR